MLFLSVHNLLYLFIFRRGMDGQGGDTGTWGLNNRIALI